MSVIGFITMDDKTPDKRGLFRVSVPFIGRGTTAVVALILNRRSISIELNLEYVSMARRRISRWPETNIHTGEMKSKQISPKKRLGCASLSPVFDSLYE